MRQHTHWRWHLDEVYVRVQGEMKYLWRAVDQEGEVLESFVTTKRDKDAALKFMKITGSTEYAVVSDSAGHVYVFAADHAAVELDGLAGGVSSISVGQILAA